MAGGAKRVAVIDVGTNSTRLLVADVRGAAVEEVERRTTVTRLGRGVDVSGQLSSGGVERVCETVASYVALQEELGARAWCGRSPPARSATPPTATLSSPSCASASRSRAEVLDGDAGGPPHLPWGDRGPPARRRHRWSSTSAAARPSWSSAAGAEISFSTSLQVGVVRQSERRISSDPPAADELDWLAGEIEAVLDEAIAKRPEAHANIGIGVAGTPTSLAAIELELDPYDPEQVHGHELSLPAVQRMLARLSTVPLAERAAITGLHSDRAPTIVAGVVILIEVMRAFGLEEITVSEHDILHGAAIEAAAA